MNHCVNINSQEFIDLQRKADINPIILASKVSIWQEENGLDNFPTLSQLFSENAVNYVIDAVQILNSSEAEVVFKKVEKGNWTLDKALTELQIPKTQKQIILQSGKTDRKDIVTDLLVNYSYAVEINTAKENNAEYRHITDGGSFTINDSFYTFESDEDLPEGFGVDTYFKDGIKITKIEYKEAKTQAEKEIPKTRIDASNTQYYYKLTVAGGTNYTENEISTPAITPNIKGHAQFSTDKGIGWFRSDDKAGKIIGSEEMEDPFGNDPIIGDFIRDTPKTKIRRILEVQSDLFQKGRDSGDLSDLDIKQGFKFTTDKGEIEVSDVLTGTMVVKNLTTNKSSQLSKQEFAKLYKDRVGNSVTTKNDFLQLLNKDNNWATFFVKSIIQDSARKGYEKVLFPTGNTASKVEGHTTLEEFKKQKEDRIKVLEDKLKTLEDKEYAYKTENLIPTKDNNYARVRVSFEDGTVKEGNNEGIILEKYNRENNLGIFNADSVKSINIELNQLKQELERVETEGFGALKPIYNFYENTVANILKKQGLVSNVITDEYGNTWNEVELDENKKQPISLTSRNFNNVQKVSTKEEVKPLLDEDILSSEKFINFVEEQNSQQMFPLPTKLLLEHFKKCK
jgi:hypothetical protein